jgi:hypothetical protein
MYVKLQVFVPVTHGDAVKAALAEAGAGRIGNYDSCMWSTPGGGQFRPLGGSNPFIGRHGELEKVDELMIDCLVEATIIKDVIAAMKKAHPYETPVWQYWPVYFE